MKALVFGFLLFAVKSSYAGVPEEIRSCDTNAKCIGYYEGFNCSCNRGYKGSNHGCVNIDECVETPDVCTVTETCNDIIGSYNCTCGDIDTICHEEAACLNETADSVQCICNSGYTGNGTFCVDIDECYLRTHNCSDNALCENSIGSYTCTCYNGYEGDGFTCTDIDECARETHDCVHPRTCNNTVGSFDCVCGMDGFCDDNAYCAEVENVTSCFCDSGYQGSGVECSDVDECKASPGCHEEASCINTLGSYRCDCNESYKGDGFICSNGIMNVLSVSVTIYSMAATLITYARL